MAVKDLTFILVMTPLKCWHLVFASGCVLGLFLMLNLECVYCEMKRGDALFFHSNLLHSSEPNNSNEPRWLLIGCYNTKHNLCNDLPGHPSYNYMEKWTDDQIIEVGTKQWMKFRDEALQAAIQSQSDYDWMNYRSLRK